MFERFRKRFNENLFPVPANATATSPIEFAFDPEEVTRNKELWTQQQAAQERVLHWPAQYYEHFLIVGLPPDNNFSNIAVELVKGFLSAQHSDGFVERPTFKPQLLFSYPPEKSLPVPEEYVSGFCFPKGVAPELLPRNRKYTLQQLFQPSYTRTREEQCFVFFLKAADMRHFPLYGVCLYSMEMIHRPPHLARSSYPDCTQPYSKYMIAAPRCYCLLSHYPFFDLHFNMLRMLVDSERALTCRELAQELNTSPFPLESTLRHSPSAPQLLEGSQYMSSLAALKSVCHACLDLIHNGCLQVPAMNMRHRRSGSTVDKLMSYLGLGFTRQRSGKSDDYDWADAARLEAAASLPDEGRGSGNWDSDTLSPGVESQLHGQCGQRCQVCGRPLRPGSGYSGVPEGGEDADAGEDTEAGEGAGAGVAEAGGKEDAASEGSEGEGSDRGDNAVERPPSAADMLTRAGFGSEQLLGGPGDEACGGDVQCLNVELEHTAAAAAAAADTGALDEVAAVLNAGGDSQHVNMEGDVAQMGAEENAREAKGLVEWVGDADLDAEPGVGISGTPPLAPAPGGAGAAAAAVSRDALPSGSEEPGASQQSNITQPSTSTDAGQCDDAEGAANQVEKPCSSVSAPPPDACICTDPPDPPHAHSLLAPTTAPAPHTHSPISPELDRTPSSPPAAALPDTFSLPLAAQVPTGITALVASILPSVASSSARRSLPFKHIASSSAPNTQDAVEIPSASLLSPLRADSSALLSSPSAEASALSSPPPADSPALRAASPFVGGPVQELVRSPSIKARRARSAGVLSNSYEAPGSTVEAPTPIRAWSPPPSLSSSWLQKNSEVLGEVERSDGSECSSHASSGTAAGWLMWKNVFRSLRSVQPGAPDSFSSQSQADTRSKDTDNPYVKKLFLYVQESQSNKLRSELRAATTHSETICDSVVPEADDSLFVQPRAASFGTRSRRSTDSFSSRRSSSRTQDPASRPPVSRNSRTNLQIHSPTQTSLKIHSPTQTLLPSRQSFSNNSFTDSPHNSFTTLPRFPHAGANPNIHASPGGFTSPLPPSTPPSEFPSQQPPLPAQTPPLPLHQRPPIPLPPSPSQMSPSPRPPPHTFTTPIASTNPDASRPPRAPHPPSPFSPSLSSGPFPPPAPVPVLPATSEPLVSMGSLADGLDTRSSAPPCNAPPGDPANSDCAAVEADPQLDLLPPLRRHPASHHPSRLILPGGDLDPWDQDTPRLVETNSTERVALCTPTGGHPSEVPRPWEALQSRSQPLPPRQTSSQPRSPQQDATPEHPPSQARQLPSPLDVHCDTNPDQIDPDPRQINSPPVASPIPAVPLLSPSSIHLYSTSSLATVRRYASSQDTPTTPDSPSTASPTPSAAATNRGDNQLGEGAFHDAGVEVSLEGAQGGEAGVVDGKAQGTPSPRVDSSPVRRSLFWGWANMSGAAKRSRSPQARSCLSDGEEEPQARPHPRGPTRHRRAGSDGDQFRFNGWLTQLGMSSSRDSTPPPAARAGGQPAEEVCDAAKAAATQMHRQSQSEPTLPPRFPLDGEGGLGDRLLDASAHLKVLERLAGRRVIYPGEMLVLESDQGVASAGGRGAIVFQRPELPVKFTVVGLDQDVLRYADEELVHHLRCGTVGALCRYLSIPNILTLLSAVMLEQKIVLACPSVSVLAAVSLSLVPLLHPFMWQNLFMPVLPANLSVLLQSPAPFVLGLVCSDVQDLLQPPYILDQESVEGMQAEINNNWVVVHVLQDTVTLGMYVPRAKLPGSGNLTTSMKRLHTLLRQACPSERASAENLALPPNAATAAAGPNPPTSSGQHQPTTANNWWEMDATQQSAAEEFCLLINHHWQTQFADLHKYSIARVDDAGARVPVLMDDVFVDSFSWWDRPFMKEFVNTRMFQVYSDRLLQTAPDKDALPL